MARAYGRGWNDALQRLRHIFAEMPQQLPALTAKDHAALRCLDAVAGQMLVESHPLKGRTNAELAKRFGCCPRTVQNWRAEGAPLDGGGAVMIRWLGGRRYVPKLTEERFHRQLESARFRALHRRAIGWLRRLRQLQQEQRHPVT